MFETVFGSALSPRAGKVIRHKIDRRQSRVVLAWFCTAAYLHIEEVRMSVPSQVDGVRALAEPLARQAGLVIENVTVTPAGKRRVLRVTVDLPEDRTGGVPMDSVATAAQAISAALDESSVMGGMPYTLEVSSPGADRPLTERRHWMRARGRLVELIPPAGTAAAWPAKAAIGRLTAVTDAGLILDGVREVSWQDIGSGRVELEFGHPGALDDLDDGEEDADDTDLDDDEDDEDTDDNTEGEG
jgi:ribosome maturation factor RimP